MFKVKLPYKRPQVKEGASRHVTCYFGKEKDYKDVKIPLELVPNWQIEALKKFEDLLTKFRNLKVQLDSCVHCGNCADACQFFLGTGDPRNMPVARQDLMRMVYKKYFTRTGKFLPRLYAASPFDENLLKLWYTYFYQCSECRRCAYFCPYGIDTAEITMAAREIMASIGYATKYVTEVIAKVYKTGNNLGITPMAWKDSSEFLSGELKEMYGIDIPLPVDLKGAEVLLVPPSADNFVNVNTMMGYAVMFYGAGISWTTSTYCNEGGNFGLYFNRYNLKKVNKRILQAARDLGVKMILWGECGHAWRSGLVYTDTMNGPLTDFTPPYPVHICEFTADLMKRGAFKIDKTANDDVLVTLHDPCNVARASGMFEPQRDMIKLTCNRFIEMHKDTIREKTYCCGAGGGLLADELMEVRMAGAKPRAEAVRATGANYLAVPCAICKANLPEGMKHHNVPAEVGGVHDLLLKSIVLGKGTGA